MASNVTPIKSGIPWTSTSTIGGVTRIHPPYPDDDPTKIWKGVANVDVRGVAIAIEMLDECERCEKVGHGTSICDLSDLEDWARLGTQFRNIVADYLQRARGIGPEVERGFCAVLSDLLSIVFEGGVDGRVTARRYRDLYPGADNRGKQPD